MDNKLKQKVAIYVRVSTVYQIDKDSLQVQKRELEAYSEFVLGIKDYAIFEDAGYSAKNTDRPSFQNMMRRVRTGEFSHILVWKIDRISRNLLDFAAMYNELKRNGIVFVSKHEQFDTSSAMGEAMLKIILVFAELERNITSERVTSVMISRAASGQWNGGRITYGYNYDKELKQLSINEKTAEIVRLIYNSYLVDNSVTYIAKKLNGRGIPSPSAKEWTATVISKMLKNPFYLGTYVYNKTDQKYDQKLKSEDEWITIQQHHPAIIDEELFDRVQIALKKNKRGGLTEGSTVKRKHTHLFAGLLTCNQCGANMSATPDRARADGSIHSVYACHRRRRSTNECTNKYISDVTVAPFVITFISNIYKSMGSLSAEMSIEEFQTFLLKGDCFNSVLTIEPSGLEELKQSILKNSQSEEYDPPAVFVPSKKVSDDYSYLSEQKSKAENALNRLKAVYYYGDSAMPPEEYISEKQKLTKTVEELDAKLKKAKAISDFAADTYFADKASYFIVADKLIKRKKIDYEKHIRAIDKGILKHFLNTIINKISVDDGKIISVTFKNDISIIFSYK